MSDPNLIFINEFIYPNGSVYRGQMEKTPIEKRDSRTNPIEECRHGYGIQIWPDGAKYEGYW